MFFLIVYLSFLQIHFDYVNQAIQKLSVGVTAQEQITEPEFLLYDVISYDLNLKVDSRNALIAANNTIVYETMDYITDLRFHFAGMTLDSVIESGSSLNFSRNEDILIIEFTAQKSPGVRDSVTIYYQGRPERGLYFRTNDYGDTIVYTHNEPYDARYWFPCKDYPSDKALLNFKIEYRKNLTSVSNGVLTDSQTAEPGWICDYWQEESPIATYLIAFAVGPFHKIEESFIQGDSSMPVHYYVYPEDRERGIPALKATIPMLEFYSAFIGLYPFFSEKYTMVEVPLREANAMENQTCTMMRDKVMDNREIIAHELAHHWWGNALTPAGFSDIWLNEGFASYFDALYTEFAEGENRFMDRLAIYRSGIFQDGSVVYPVGNPPAEQLFSATVYFKGAWILHMLRFEIGKNAFQEIIREYFFRFKYKNVSSADFQSVCEEITGKNLDYFFDQWLFRGGIPQLFLTWNQNENILSFTIDQIQDGEIYDLFIEVEVRGVNSDTLIVVHNDSRSNSYQINIGEPVISMELDPFNRILNENNSPVYLIPKNPQISLIYPNPFNEMVTITVELERIQEIEISIWNVLGQKIERLFKGRIGTGLHKLNWSAQNRASGVYFCRLDSESASDIKKLVLLK